MIAMLNHRMLPKRLLQRLRLLVEFLRCLSTSAPERLMFPKVMRFKFWLLWSSHGLSQGKLDNYLPDYMTHPKGKEVLAT